MTLRFNSPRSSHSARTLFTQLIVLGIVFLLLHLVLTLFSPYVAYDEFPTLIPILIYVFLAGVTGGIIILIAPLIKNLVSQRLPDNRTAKIALLWVLAIGFMARLMMFATTPVLEDDWVRYLWEGAMGNAGVSPYEYVPAASFEVDSTGQLLPDSPDEKIMTLRSLSADNDDYGYDVAYPYLATIYPGVAQQAFRIANIINPFDLNAWRLVLLIVDSATVMLLITMLNLWQRSPLWIALYWWNPLVTLEGFNSAHMDILLVLPLLLSILLAVKKRPALSGAMLGLAVGVKLWPLMLAPLYIQPLLASKPEEVFQFQRLKTDSRKWISIILRFGFALLFVSLLGTWELLAQAFTAHSGLGAYTEEWSKNNFLFSVLVIAFHFIVENPGTYARISIAALLSCLSIFLALRVSNQQRLPALIAILSASLFLLAPAGYPWYSFWFLPLLVFYPNIGLLSLSITLPIYYLRFPLFVMEYDWIFNKILAPLEFGIPMAIMIWFAFKHRNRLSKSRS